MTIAVEGNQVLVTRPTDEKEDKSLHGLTRALVQNMVTGVHTGYKKVLMIIGVGYKAVKTGKDLQLYMGHSLMPQVGTPQAKFIISDTDTVKLSVPNENEIKAQGIDKMTTEKVSSGLIIVVDGIDKQEVGQMAAVIRGKRPPEPYHGKGIRYIDEYVRRKAGKTGK
jgi:large subunit ribosomal protein L6